MACFWHFLSAVMVIFLLLACLAWPWYKGLYLVFLYLVRRCLVHIPGDLVFSEEKQKEQIYGWKEVEGTFCGKDILYERRRKGGRKMSRKRRGKGGGEKEQKEWKKDGKKEKEKEKERKKDKFLFKANRSHNRKLQLDTIKKSRNLENHKTNEYTAISQVLYLWFR